jgi:hypothetical protein
MPTIPSLRSRRRSAPSTHWFIVGAKRLDQLDNNLAAVDLKLTPDEIQRLDEVSALPLEYPGWMLSVQGADRTDPTKARFGRR